MKIHKEKLLKEEDYKVVSDLTLHYLDLRASVFFEDEK
jgi:hypothetical protein